MKEEKLLKENTSACHKFSVTSRQKTVTSSEFGIFQGKNFHKESKNCKNDESLLVMRKFLLLIDGKVR